jgi:dipeptide/tripeptide permease
LVSLIACTVIVYVQDQVSWTVGFALPAAAMASAVLLFLAGSKHYRHVAPTESPMARVVKVVAAALRNRWVWELGLL